MSSLPVMEHYLTLQGEGYWTGAAAYFIRLAGCDVGCHWCDVKESWEIEPEQHESLETIVSWVVESEAERVVITGGEPMIHDLSQLTSLFQTANIKVHLETSGVYPLSGTFDWICLSPKKFKPVLPEWYEIANELKIIVFNSHDLIWGEEQAAKCDKNKTLLYLQPEWSRHSDTSEIIEYIKTHPKWRLSIQSHKFVNIP